MEAKSYAVKCTTEEQARECTPHGGAEAFQDGYNIKIIDSNYLVTKDSYLLDGYNIITYDEAISLGLLGELKEDLTKRGYAPGLYTYGKCSDCGCKLENVEKRAWRCKKCAGIEKQKELQSMDQVDQVKESPSEDNLVEKILNDMANNTEWQKESGYFTIEDIKIYLRKHLSSK